jgi:ribosomal protein S27AE
MGGTVTKTPPVTDIEQMLRDGWTYDEIASHYEVQVGSVKRKMKRAGKLEARESYRDYIDWEVRREHRNASVFRRIKDLYRIDDEKFVPEDRRKMAENFAWRLDKMGAVVGYDPDLEPNPASDTGGFYYAPRESSDCRYHRP